MLDISLAVSVTPAPPQGPGYQGRAGVEVTQHRLEVLHEDEGVVVRLENPVVVPGQLLSLEEHLLGFTPEFLTPREFDSQGGQVLGLLVTDRDQVDTNAQQLN